MSQAGIAAATEKKPAATESVSTLFTLQNSANTPETGGSKYFDGKESVPISQSCEISQSVWQQDFSKNLAGTRCAICAVFRKTRLVLRPTPERQYFSGILAHIPAMGLWHGLAVPINVPYGFVRPAF